MRNRFTSVALVLFIGFQITGCETIGKHMESSSGGSDMVMPRIAEATPSRLTESPSRSRGNLDYILNEKDSNLEEIVMSRPLPIILDEDSHPPIEKEHPIPLHSSESNTPPGYTENDSLREVLRERIEAVNQYLPETGGNISETKVDSDFPEVTFRCAVLRGGKFKSGDKITLRVLEEVNERGLSLKKHDLVDGYCSIEDRVQIAVVRVHGIPVTLHGYDLDGMKGLWFTDRSAGAAGSLSEELVNEGSSLLSSRVGRIARGITAVGAESIQRKAHSTSVDIPSGHEFLLGLSK